MVFLSRLMLISLMFSSYFSMIEGVSGEFQGEISKAVSLTCLGYHGMGLFAVGDVGRLFLPFNHVSIQLPHKNLNKMLHYEK